MSAIVPTKLILNVTLFEESLTAVAVIDGAASGSGLLDDPAVNEPVTGALEPISAPFCLNRVVIV